MKNNEIEVKMTVSDASHYYGTTLQYIHKRLKEEKLHSLKNQNRVYFGHETAKKLFNLKFDPKIITFQIVKGGTGKTTLSQAFAVRASLYGAKVLCIDLDQQGNLTQSLGVNPENTPVMVDYISGDVSSIKDCIVNVYPGVDLIPSRIENAVLDNKLMLEKHPLDRVYDRPFRALLSEYDLIVVDCPPALGQSVTAATLASDMIIAPLTPEKFGMSGLDILSKEISMVNKRFGKNIPLKIILNKFDNRMSLSTEVLTTIISDDRYKHSLCGTLIRVCQEFPNTSFSSSNIFSSLKNTAAKEDIDRFVQELFVGTLSDNKKKAA